MPQNPDNLLPTSILSKHPHIPGIWRSQAPPLATNNQTLFNIIAQEDIVNIERIITVFSPTEAVVFYNRCADRLDAKCSNGTSR